MATWIEFRCEGRSRPGGPYGDVLKRCWSHDHVGPMDLACDDLGSIRATLAVLREEASRTGWKRTKEGWVCPYCVNNPLPPGDRHG